ncbi:uncharacterized protein LOC113281619 isoform X2 [Papaver somniferum]|uniref:uncharacterized protein LOC113281619 isoform X2 n=1 Tax=Papaver somniferum TaxID=3469 RepID=UPI000E6F9375|nr:uncharacterized protein LOC113281619 isoform X2 [Papaver somniferum]
MGMHDADFSRMDLLVFCVAGIWSAYRSRSSSSNFVLGKSSKTIPGEPFSSTEMIKKKPCSQTTLKTVSKLGRPNTPLGYGVCFLNLTFDGFTHAIQDSVTASFFLASLRIRLSKLMRGGKL